VLRALQRSCNALPRSSSAMGDEVLHGTVALADALGRGDAAAAASLYADDGRLLTSAADLLTGRSEIEEYWRTGIAFGLARLELQTIELTVADRLAVEIGRYAFALDGGGGATVECGKYVALHRRRADGTWRRAIDVFTSNAPAGNDRKEER
jgi:uncharacterized protein (TIGR02246 family)